MAIYRYSQDGIARIARRAVRLSLSIMGFALLAGVLIAYLNGAAGKPLTILPVVMMLAAIALWSGTRSGKKARELARSTEIEINGSLTARNSMASATIAQDEVTELRYLNDGILVRGKHLRQALHLKSELDGFEDVVKRIEEWTPPQVPRVRSSSSLSVWIFTLVLANVGLLIVALTLKNPIAIPACVVEAFVLVSCAIWVWREKSVARRLKWLMLPVLVPAISLLYRAYLLWMQE